MTRRDGVLYVAEDAQHPLVGVAAHEWVHNLKRTHPHLYEQLAAEVERQGRAADYAQRMGYQAHEATEELTAAAVGDAMADVGFLERLAAENLPLFSKVARSFIQFLNGLTAQWRDQGSNQYLQDVAAFRETLIGVIREYEGQGRSTQNGTQNGAYPVSQPAAQPISQPSSAAQEATVRGAQKSISGEVGDAAFARRAQQDPQANIERGQRALAQAVRGKTSVHRAMYRAGLGWVDFVWGDEGRVKPSGKTAGGMGIAHILEARVRKDGMDEKEVLHLLGDAVEAIARGSQVGQVQTVGNTSRVGIEHGDAIVWLTQRTGSNAWMVTAYEKSPDEAAAGRATAASTDHAASLTRSMTGAGNAHSIPHQGDAGDDAPAFSRRQNDDVQKARILQGAPVAVLRGDQAPHGYPALRQWAADLFQREGGQATNPEVGAVLLDMRAVRDTLAHGMNPYKAAAFAAVKDVIEHGAVVARGEGGRSIYISAPVQIRGVDDVVTVLVHRDEHTQRMYVHSVTTKENLLKAKYSSSSTAQQGSSGKVTSGDEASVPQGKITSAQVAAELQRLLTLDVGLDANPAPQDAPENTAYSRRKSGIIDEWQDGQKSFLDATQDQENPGLRPNIQKMQAAAELRHRMAQEYDAAAASEAPRKASHAVTKGDLARAGALARDVGGAAVRGAWDAAAGAGRSMFSRMKAAPAFGKNELGGLKFNWGEIAYEEFANIIAPILKAVNMQPASAAFRKLYPSRLIPSEKAAGIAAYTSEPMNQQTDEWLELGMLSQERYQRFQKLPKNQRKGELFKQIATTKKSA